MTQFESLKDYLSLNYKDDISQGIKEKFKSDKGIDIECKIHNIFTLNCKPLEKIIDIYDNSNLFMEYTVGLSAEIMSSDENEWILHFYNVLIKSIIIGTKMVLKIESIDEVESVNSFQEDTIPSLFGLPDINSDNLEDYAEKIRSELCADINTDKNNMKYCLPVIDIKNKLGMKMWPADLPADCMGRLYFSESKATIYDPAYLNKPYIDEPIPKYSILLNVGYYRNDLVPDDIIPAAHELIHWARHQTYFYVRRLLESEFTTMNCTSESIIFDEKKSPLEKAYWYAEWQANELSIRVAMPKRLVEQAIIDYNNDESVHNPSDIPFSGNYYQNMIWKLQFDFNVPYVIVKKRLRQLGYDFADGTFIELEDCQYPPLTFAQGSLKQNQTFVIDRDNYERLLREDKNFAELIESKICVYTGYVVCLNDLKYIKSFNSDGNLCFILSEYGREHADECCLMFTYDEINEKEQLDVHVYLCSTVISDTKQHRFEKQKNIKFAESLDSIIKKRIKDKEMYDRILKEGKTTFSEALKYIMRISRIKKDDLAEFLGCDPKTIQNYRNSSTLPNTIEKVMMICLALETGPTVSSYLIEKSIGAIPDIGMKRTAYTFLLDHTYCTLEEWNRIISNFDLPPIRF